MADPKRYWRLVLILTVVFCILAALGYWVVPGVRAGTVPAIGGLIWHGLGAIQWVIVNRYEPLAARIGEATSPSLRPVALLGLIVGSALLVSMLLCLPFLLIGNRAGPTGETTEGPSTKSTP